MKRARNENDKRSRREDILRAAEALFQENNFQTVTMADLAKMAGIAKGTVFLYFKTKESVYLTLLDDILDEWAQKLTDELPSFTERLSTADNTLDLITRSFSWSREPTMMRLLVILEPILLQNIPADQLRSFREKFVDRVNLIGKEVEQVEPGVDSGTGPKLIVEMLGAAIGIAQISGLVSPNESTATQAPPVDSNFLAERRLRDLSKWQSAKISS